MSKEIVKSVKILDCSAEKNKIIPNDIYEVIRMPLGHIWLELNGVPVSMRIEEITIVDPRYARYTVDYAMAIKPANLPIHFFQSLKLRCDFDLANSRWIDVISDEFADGNEWEFQGIQLGITATTSREFEDEILIDRYTRVPYYDSWHSNWETDYEFRLAWKSFEADEDLSVCFYSTQ